MTEETRHRICLSLLVLFVFIFLLLLVFGFVYALLWLLLGCLTVVILMRMHNPFYETEAARIRSLAEKHRQKREARKKAKSAEGKYHNEFVADHVLVGKDAPFNREYRVDKAEFTIGSDEKCSLVLNTPQRTVSRAHCRIIYRMHSHAYLIEDMHSTNGTYLGTRRLEPNTPERLGDNATIIISRYRFEFVRK